MLNSYIIYNWCIIFLYIYLYNYLLCIYKNNKINYLLNNISVQYVYNIKNKKYNQYWYYNVYIFIANNVYMNIIMTIIKINVLYVNNSYIFNICNKCNLFDISNNI